RLEVRAVSGREVGRVRHAREVAVALRIRGNAAYGRILGAALVPGTAVVAADVVAAAVGQDARDVDVVVAARLALEVDRRPRIALSVADDPGPPVGRDRDVAQRVVLADASARRCLVLTRDVRRPDRS